MEIIFHAPRRKPLIAAAGGWFTGSVLTAALARLAVQGHHARRRRLARRMARA